MWYLNLEKTSIASRNYTVPYCQTTENFHWLMRSEKPKKRQFQNIEKIEKKFKNC